MTRTIKLNIHGTASIRTVFFAVKELFCAGYTGRNRHQVMKHIEELKELGVPAPDQVPTLYPVPVNLLSNTDQVMVKGVKTSGEVECVALMDGDVFYITVGSDHTDRELEKQDIGEAKRVCPKIIAQDAWLYSDVLHGWDEIVLRAYVKKQGKKRLYQEGRLGQLLRIEELVKIFDIKQRSTVLFSGTVPLLLDVVYSDLFEMEMFDPILNRRITHRYIIRTGI